MNSAQRGSPAFTVYAAAGTNDGTLRSSKTEKGGLRSSRADYTMANNNTEAMIQCPFFLRIKENTITCEGYASGTCMITKFRDPALRRAHLKANCFQPDGGECFMAKSLFKKYEEE